VPAPSPSPSCVAAVAFAPSGAQAQSSVYVIDHVADGDTVTLRNGQRVRLVQIDTPEVYFGTQCYGPQASATTKRLLAPGTRVRLLMEPATDPVDQYERLLRYVVRVKDGLNVKYATRPRWGRRPVLLRRSKGVATQTCSNAWRLGRGGRSSGCGDGARTLPTTQHAESALEDRGMARTRRRVNALRTLLRQAGPIPSAAKPVRPINANHVAELDGLYRGAWRCPADAHLASGSKATRGMRTRRYGPSG
jgi:Staphylococcal nuclease homologue